MYESPEKSTYPGVAGTSACAQLVKAEPPVAQSMSELAQIQRMVSDRLESLFIRLDPVLTSVPPSTNGGCEPCRPASCAFDSVLASRIDDETRTLRALDQLLLRLAI